MASRRRGLGHRVGQWTCWGIWWEFLGGELYYSARAGAFLSILLLIALAAVPRVAVALKRRR